MGFLLGELTLAPARWRLVTLYTNATEPDRHGTRPRHENSPFDAGELIATHGRRPAGKSTDLSHYLLVTWNLTARKMIFLRPLRPTAGPGWSSARTPNSDWPAISSKTCAVPARKHPTKSGRLSPARIRRGFRNIRGATAMPPSAPKPSRPGPGRPPGSRNAQRAPRNNPGKTIKTDTVVKGGKMQAA
jgi:hypothetical protein